MFRPIQPITILLLLLFLSGSYVNAQISINTTGSEPDSSAMLDISSIDKGMLVPRMTTDERGAIVSPASSLLVYDTDTDSFWYYDNGQWNEIGTKKVPDYEYKDPSLLSTMDIGSDNKLMAYKDGVLFIAEDTGTKLRAVDVSDPGNPSLISELTYSSGAKNGMAIKGDYLYISYQVGLNGGGIMTVNISDPAAMTYTSLTDPSYVFTVCAVAGDVLCVLNYDAETLELFDITDAANPAPVTTLSGISLSTGNPDGALHTYNGMAYIFHFVPNSYDRQLSIVDVSDIQNPTIVGTLVDNNFMGLSASGEPYLLKKHQDYLFLTGANSANRGNIIDVSDPTSPIFAGYMPNNPYSGTGFDVAGNFFYTIGLAQFVSDNAMAVYDISDPTNHQLIFDEAIPTPNTDWPAMEVIIDNNVAYCLLKKDLLIYKVGLDYTTVTYPDGTTGLAPLDVQELTLASHTLSLSNVTNTVDLSGYLDNTDDQTIDVFSLSGDNLQLSLESDGQSTQTLDLSSFKDNTDDQTIDEFSLSGDNLRLSLESDGQNTKTLDLSSFKDNTDDQTIDVFSLSGDNLQLSLESDGQNTKTLDLSSFKDNTDNQELSISNNTLSISGDSNTVSLGSYLDNTDNQTIDKLNLNGTTLELSLESDGQGDQTVDLATVNTDNQTIDKLNLNGTTLEISLQDDGQSDQTVDLVSLNTDEQDLSFSGTTLNITNGASVDLSSLQVPVGTIQMWPTSTPPTGWLICNGSSFSSGTYPDLAAVLGTTTLPNFNGRFPLGTGNSGTNGSTQHNISSSGGEEKHTLTTNEMPSHSHGAGTLKTSQEYLSETGSGTQDKRDGGGTKLYAYDDITGNTASVGGNQSHNNMPPFYTINFIIKAE